MEQTQSLEAKDNDVAAGVSTSQMPEPVLPDVGLAIACDAASFQLCRPKLMPLKTYSFVKMSQARTRANNAPTNNATTRTGN